jgi:ribosomal protein S24E
MPTITELYKSTPKGKKRNIIASIATECGISEQTVYQKIYGNVKFSKLEKERVSEILKISVD